MSYPPRPPLVPFGVVTMPLAGMGAHMMVGAYGGGGGPALLPAPTGKPTGAVISRGPTRAHNGNKEGDGPAITVFIGNITPRAPDPMIRALLSACGPVLSWKRVSSFGFAEFAGVEAALRCVRMLHERKLADRPLVAKTDGKMQALVDTYKTEQRSRLSNVASTGADSNYLDARAKAADDAAQRRLAQVMRDYQHDINNYEELQREEQMEKTNRALEEADIEEEKRDVIHREIGKFRESMKEEASVVVNRKRDKDGKDDKRERERDKDKDREEKRDEKRDKERDKERERDRERGDKDRETREKRRRSPSRGKERRDERDKERDREREERERERDRERDKEREREREREREVREREREREVRERERERERERDRDRERERSRSRSGSRARGGGGGGGGSRDAGRDSGRDSGRDTRREKELSEEARERKRHEKKQREKEAAYQERLRKWESRERRKAKDYEREKEKERCREEEREREAKRLKEFLEDYDDERDDHKYYRGKELQRRLGARVREASSDAREREKEQDELAALRKRILAEGGTEHAVEQARKEQEALYQPRLLIDVNLEHELQRERERQRALEREEARREARERLERERERYLRAQATRQLPTEAEPIDSDSSGGASPPGTSPPGTPPPAWDVSPPQPPPQESSDGGTTPPRPPSPSPAAERRSRREHSATSRSGDSSPITISFKHNSEHTHSVEPVRRGVHAAFADDEDEPRAAPPAHPTPAAPAVPAGKQRHSHKGKDKSSHKERAREKERDKRSAAAASAGAGQETQDKQDSAEEKRRHIKSLIDKIPTQKEALFRYKLDTRQIDNTLMEKKIRPWINKKIIEYIGEPEPTLVDFICSKVLAGSKPQGILDDVQMVLDEEAEVFVVKMWRLLIYELEAKRAGLAPAAAAAAGPPGGEGEPAGGEPAAGGGDV